MHETLRIITGEDWRWSGGLVWREPTRVESIGPAPNIPSVVIYIFSFLFRLILPPSSSVLSSFVLLGFFFKFYFEKKKKKTIDSSSDARAAAPFRFLLGISKEVPGRATDPGRRTRDNRTYIYDGQFFLFFFLFRFVIYLFLFLFLFFFAFA